MPDTSYLQRIIDRQASPVIPPDTYRVTSLTIPRGKTVSGYGATIIGTSDTVMFCDKGVTINGLVVNSSIAAKWLLDIYGPNFRAFQCTFSGGSEGCVNLAQSWCSSFLSCVFGVYGPVGIQAYNSSNALVITDCRIDGFHKDSVGIAFGSKVLTVHGVTLESLAAGIMIDAAEGISIQGCYFEAIRVACIHDHPAHPCCGVSIGGCFFESLAGAKGIRLENTDGAHIAGNSFRGDGVDMEIGDLSTNVVALANASRIT